MIVSEQIVDAIKGKLSQKYPDIAVYVNNCPENFTRPGFCIKESRTFEWPAGKNTVRIRARFTITPLPLLDAAGDADRMNLAELQSKVMSIFRTGYVQVGNRKITVAIKNQGINSRGSAVELKFDYFDDRTDEVDDTPFITDVNFNLNKEE